MVKKINWSAELLATLPTSKDAAIAAGSRHYFPNVECCNGHNTCWIVNKGCFLCAREKTKANAEKRRRKLGMSIQVANIPPEGTRHENLVSTGITQKIYSHSQERNILELKVICDCGKQYWIRNDGFFAQNRCRSCSQRDISTKHGLTSGVKSNFPVDEANILIYSLFTSAKKRANKSGIEFSIKATDIEVVSHCPVFGFELVWEIRGDKDNRTPRENAPSLDRLDPNKGYTKENSLVVSYKANVLKNSGTAREHDLVADWLEQFEKE